MCVIYICMYNVFLISCSHPQLSQLRFYSLSSLEQLGSFQAHQRPCTAALPGPQKHQSLDCGYVLVMIFDLSKDVYYWNIIIYMERLDGHGWTTIWKKCMYMYVDACDS